MTIHGSSGTTNYYYLKDLSNTVLALANSSGSIAESYVYDAYGNVTILNRSGTVIPTSADESRFLLGYTMEQIQRFLWVHSALFL